MAKKRTKRKKLKPAWKEYEDQIFEKLRKEFNTHEVLPDHKVIGKHSQEERQIDVWVNGKIGDRPIKVAVDCKHLNKNVDVKMVESMIGMFDDVNADVGIIITNRGFSPAAKRRAAAARVQIDVIEFMLLDDYHYRDQHNCFVCYDSRSDDEGYWSRVVNEYSAFPAEGERDSIEVGYCEVCQGFHIRCPDCGSKTGIGEYQYKKDIECDGGCGLLFNVSYRNIQDGSYSEYVVVKKK